MSTTIGGRSRTGTSRTLRLLNGLQVRIEITSDADYAARLDVHHGARRWVYGIDSNEIATLIDGFDDEGRVDDPREPEWMREVFVQLGVDW
ncbi:hypothetical protein E6P09_09650 [Haloferax mediterranei ATCC 33500]|uniref:Uncharacterized protein n=1 Tax=Haloferax mediterranei (strain ATCC 33500 / DSM 1411 / JCM 8866 / NBRC 14739 / NCIMB 2177 / R-4) TaxID=523841 RepID=M0J5S0_HALMT|nr:hypothetical protein [Haloferax mediterranei]AHZ21603.1 hypothetical protein BM92_02555 [Haloferax mediterranei ATCC 33500]EMA03698.1 hypothetical protein C439_03875 [Haloferax mediterranei ATCC 33500]MDX5989131.1 hypothetical protein [Haloferax mediterranei ATCC 33500]QCQ75512.1 hypothetical protein E6P09_09650 [Haloferax mediterranei ATCC 33500]